MQVNALHNVAINILLAFVTELVRDLKILLSWILASGPGQLSRYSDLLRAGGSGDRIPVGAKFLAPVQNGAVCPTQPPGRWVSDHSRV